MKPIRVAIVEDDLELLNEVCKVLQSRDEIEVIMPFSNAEDFIRDVAELSLDVVMMDINLPKQSGIECIALLKPNYPKLQFMMWTSFEDDEMIFDALKAGASGYILKTATTQQLAQAILDLFNGGSPMSSGIARKVIASFHAPVVKQVQFNLTNREREVLSLLAKGYRYKEIADLLSISLETVRSHVHHIYEKLQVSSRTDALNRVFPKN